MTQLIPVIDLKNNLVVHAKLGQRDHYLPLSSPLCASCEVENVIAAFLKLYPFDIIYIADLDAITATGNQQSLIEELLMAYPGITFWVDSGYQACPSTLNRFANYQAVLGSESYSEEKLTDLSTFAKKFILSLDFSAQQALGATALFQETHYWTEKMLVMTLARVGSHLGVDLEKLLFYQSLAPDKTWIAAGGIRGVEDVLALKKQHIRYALCASALHTQAITASDLQQLMHIV